MSIIEFIRDRARFYNCPVCGRSLKGCDIQVLSHEEERFHLQVTCAQCQVTFIVVLAIAGGGGGGGGVGRNGRPRLATSRAEPRAGADLGRRDPRRAPVLKTFQGTLTDLLHQPDHSRSADLHAVPDLNARVGVMNRAASAQPGVLTFGAMTCEQQRAGPAKGLSRRRRRGARPARGRSGAARPPRRQPVEPPRRRSSRASRPRRGPRRARRGAERRPHRDHVHRLRHRVRQPRPPRRCAQRLAEHATVLTWAAEHQSVLGADPAPSG